MATKIIEYNGAKIYEIDGRFYFNGLQFRTLKKAKAAVDNSKKWN